MELNFATGAVAGCKVLGDCISVRRASTKWAAWNDGHYSVFGNDTAALTDRGILIEPAATNYVRYSRDLSNPVWEKSDIAVTPTTGVDRSENSASTLTATANGAKVSQSIALSNGERTLSAFLRRRTGNGPVTISYDGGTSWLPCVLTPEFQRFTIASDSLENPRIVVRFESAGDAIDIDFVQLEGRRWGTSPILTHNAPANRAADAAAIIGAALAPLNSGTFSLVLEGAGTAAGNFKRNQPAIIAGGSAKVFTLPYEANVVRTQDTATGAALMAVLGSGPSPLLAQGSMAKPFKIGASSDIPAGISLVADAGEIVTSASAYSSTGGPWYLGGADGMYSGYFTRLTVWSAKLPDATLRSLTNTEIAPAAVSDAGLPWKNHSVREQVTVNGALYVVQSGTRKDRTTGSSPVQAGPFGTLTRFHMFSNNPWSYDQIKGSGGSERSELAGYETRSRGRFEGNAVESIWGANSFYVEKGDPITTNWLALGQMHVQSGGIPALAFSLQNGEFLAVDFHSDSTAGRTRQISYC